jgi:Trk-type K+ transport system membrane component
MVAGSIFDVNPADPTYLRIIMFLSFTFVGLVSFFLFKKLGVWDRAAWTTMSGSRKSLLFFLTLPGALSGAVRVGIFVLILSALIGGAGGFLRDETREARRAELRSDVKAAVHKEFKKHGF